MNNNCTEKSFRKTGLAGNRTRFEPVTDWIRTGSSVHWTAMFSWTSIYCPGQSVTRMCCSRNDSEASFSSLRMHCLLCLLCLCDCQSGPGCGGYKIGHWFSARMLQALSKRLRTGQSGVRAPVEARFFSSTTSRPALGPAEPSIQLVMRFLKWVRRSELEIERLPPSTMKVKNEWSYTSAPLHAIRARTGTVYLYLLVKAYHFT